MEYLEAPDLKERATEIIKLLEMSHINIERIEFLRSKGSSSRNIIARCHTLGKLMQKAMRTKPFYAIEFLETFEKLSKDEQDETIIHELLHIPKTFGGGFRYHNFVCAKNIKTLHNRFKELKNSM